MNYMHHIKEICWKNHNQQNINYYQWKNDLVEEKFFGIVLIKLLYKWQWLFIIVKYKSIDYIVHESFDIIWHNMSIFVFHINELLKSPKNHLNKKIINLYVLGILYIILSKYIIGIVFKLKLIFYVTMISCCNWMIKKFPLKLPFNVNSNVTQNSFVELLNNFWIFHNYCHNFFVFF